ncbi:MAG: T9SS type A sorting domain-containing protein [Muribaculaceae bacterium]|nr:T9SS type A sorting domain-containing protein [Muribaculaceae bacterium]
MKRNHIIKVGWFAGLVMSCFCQTQAQEAVPCLIFTGNYGTPNCIDLNKLNRITFGEDEMTISSSTESNEPAVTLLYSMFNRLEIGDAVPTDLTAVEIVEAEGNAKLCFNADAKALTLESGSNKPYSIGIFSLSGTMIATSNMKAGQSLSIGTLADGTYIAVATDGKSQLTLKFILK